MNIPFQQNGTDGGSGREPLDRAADIVVREVLRLSENERVLIATNPQADVSEISVALYHAVSRAGGSPVLVYQPVKTQLDFTERAVIGAISSAPDVFLSMSARKLGKDREAILKPYVHDGTRYDSLFHYLLHGRKSLRSFWSPGVTVDSFCRTVPIDYGRLQRESRAVKVLLDRGTGLHVTSPNGTDLTIGIDGRFAIVDDGDFSKPGTGGNIPAGETFISPVVGSAEGVIVFDGSISTHTGTLVLRKPIRATVKGGFVTEIEGGEEADRFRESIELAERNALQFERDGTLEAGKGEVYRRNSRNVESSGSVSTRKPGSRETCWKTRRRTGPVISRSDRTTTRTPRP